MKITVLTFEVINKYVSNTIMIMSLSKTLCNHINSKTYI